MMTLEDYALDVGLTIEEIKALCDKIGILVNGVIEKKGKGTINDVVQNKK